MKTTNGFLNCYELDEWYTLMQDKAYDNISNNDDHYPYWLENDESDDLIFDDALYGVV